MDRLSAPMKLYRDQQIVAYRGMSRLEGGGASRKLRIAGHKVIDYLMQKTFGTVLFWVLFLDEIIWRYAIYMVIIHGKYR